MPFLGAAYLRCSDPRQDKFIEQQREEKIRRAAADGVVIPPENWFVDEGISGRSTKKRSSYLALIKRAEAQRDAIAARECAEGNDGGLRIAERLTREGVTPPGRHDLAR